MNTAPFPTEVPNWITGAAVPAASGEWCDKLSPVTGSLLARFARSGAADAAAAVSAAADAQPAWAALPGVRRGEILLDVAQRLRARRREMAEIVAAETGKSLAHALGETDGAVQLGNFFSGEGQRLFGRTTTSGAANKYIASVRQPVGLAGLIIAANTPIANVAWKVFPALVCGNAAVLKAAEDTPATAHRFAEIAAEAGLPSGVLNVLQGTGPEAGPPLVDDPRVGVVSFTGSTRVGRLVGEQCARRLARVSLELGGKNPLVVCDDADLDNAVKWTLLSAFSNAGQRCAAASRIIVFDAVYDAFRGKLLAGTAAQKVGPADTDDFGPVINARQLENMEGAVAEARARGASVIAGGRRLPREGFFMAPTLLEEVAPGDPISRTELFGPVACLYRVPDFEAALALANDSPYGLTACIHTRSVHRALEFSMRVQAGVAMVNAGTFGSEPHLPFGGVKDSGNGTREPGTEALDVYSTLKNICVITEPART